MDSIDIEQRIIAIEAKLDAVLAILSGAQGVPGGAIAQTAQYPAPVPYYDQGQVQPYGSGSNGDAIPYQYQLAGTDADPVLTPEVLDLIRRGRKIQAIKVYRERTNVGLKAAKDAIDLAAKRMGW